MSAKLINIVLDLETLSTQENAAILQIGCSIPYFDRKNVPLGLACDFEATVSYDAALQSEFHADNDTMLWWEKQLVSTRKLVFSGQDSYAEVFDKFKEWIESIKSGGADVAVWGNGADFDNRLLTYSLDSMGYHKVWRYYHNRCLRTLKAIFPVDIVRNPTHIAHTALGDARYEAEVLNAIVKDYELLGLQ